MKAVEVQTENESRVMLTILSESEQQDRLLKYYKEYFNKYIDCEDCKFLKIDSDEIGEEINYCSKIMKVVLNSRTSCGCEKGEPK